MLIRLEMKLLRCSIFSSYFSLLVLDIKLHNPTIPREISFHTGVLATRNIYIFFLSVNNFTDIRIDFVRTLKKLEMLCCYVVYATTFNYFK